MTANDVEPDDARRALADVRDQQTLVAQRFATLRRRHLAVGLAMGVAAGALAIDNLVVLAVAMIVYLVGVVYVFGTPTRVGVVPRDDVRSGVQVFCGAFALLGILALALVGAGLRLWWLCVAAGVIAVAAANVVGRWRLATIRRRIVDGVGDTR